MGIQGIAHQRAVRALERAGFRVVRQGKHIVMSDGKRIVTIPRHDPVNANTMGVIVRGASLTHYTSSRPGALGENGAKRVGKNGRNGSV